MPPAQDEARLPVAIVTGFLGSGKTTLVNHILTQLHGVKIGVMVNEIGDIAIDSELIIGAGDDMVELANGCICCSINNDLLDAIFRVLQRRPRVEYLIVETSGLADPLPIVLTFLRSELRDLVRIDAIVTVADAESFSLDLFDSEAAANQLRYADAILLNKCDLVGEDTAQFVEEKIAAIGGGRIVRTTRAEIPLPLILGAGAFQPDRYSAERGHDHLAADGFEAVSFASDRAFLADGFQSFLEELPGNVFRAKGILAIDGSDTRHVFHLVGKRFTLDPAPPGPACGSRLVLIGKNLDADRLRAQLAACLAPSITAVAPG
ncbi:MAG TPA: GTP-binding protein [Stellaceae bacterium]